MLLRHSRENFAPPAAVAGCDKCGLVQRIEEMPPGSAAHCARCGFHLSHHRANSRARTLAFALAALILYLPSNFYPLVTADYYGMHSTTTIFQGVSALFGKGQYVIAAFVFITGIFSPGVKILGLVFLSWTLNWPRAMRARAWACRIVRVVDPWNMLEVILLAVFVAMIEMEQVASVHPGRGAFFLTAVVALMLLATVSFDWRPLWERAEEMELHEQTP
jgi:paraquat-inducible protein A